MMKKLKITILTILFVISGFLFMLIISSWVSQISSGRTIIKETIVEDKQTKQELENCKNLLKNRENSVAKLDTKLPYFIELSLSEFNISSDKLDEKSWKNFLSLYSLRHPQIAQNSKFFSWNGFLSSSRSLTIEDVEDLIKKGYDLNKKDELGASFLSTYVRYMKDFDRTFFERLSDLGVDYVLKMDSNDFGKNANNDIIMATLLNPNRKMANEFFDFLDTKGVSMTNKNYAFNLMILNNLEPKYKNKYYQRMLVDLDVNLPVTKSQGEEIKAYQLILNNNANNDTIDMLLGKDIQLNKSKNGINILHSVTENTNISPLNYQRLIDLGVDINAQTVENKATPLMLAISKGRVMQVKSLLSNGANVNLKDRQGHDIYYYLNILKDKKAKEEIKNILSSDKN